MKRRILITTLAAALAGCVAPAKPQGDGTKGDTNQHMPVTITYVLPGTAPTTVMLDGARDCSIGQALTEGSPCAGAGYDDYPGDPGYLFISLTDLQAAARNGLNSPYAISYPPAPFELETVANESSPSNGRGGSPRYDCLTDDPVHTNGGTGTITFTSMGADASDFHGEVTAVFDCEDYDMGLGTLVPGGSITMEF